MSNIDYYEYMKTEEWNKKRLAVFKRDNFVCQNCKSAKNLVAHHLTYDNLGNEPLSDLITLCNKCHNQLHKVDTARKESRDGVKIVRIAPDIDSEKKLLNVCLNNINGLIQASILLQPINLSMPNKIWFAFMVSMMLEKIPVNYNSFVEWLKDRDEDAFYILGGEEYLQDIMSSNGDIAEIDTYIHNIRKYTDTDYKEE